MPAKEPLLPATAVNAWVQLIDEAIGVILRHEDPAPFLAWMRDTAPVRHRQAFPPEAPQDAIQKTAGMLGWHLWNATPLPGAGFRPWLLPKPGRNDPCMCGSGAKFKHCCSPLPLPLHIEADVIWQLVIGRLSRRQVEAAIASRQISPIALAGLALRKLELGHPREAVKLLEPLFAKLPERLDERSAVAVNALCNAYDDLGMRKKKLAFLERMTRTGGRELRSEAWQRLAVIRMDEGALESASAAHHEAQRLTPGDPNIGVLEVTLLMGEKRPEDARRAAQLWLRRLKRDGNDDHAMAEFLRAAAKDPDGAFSDAGMEHAAEGASGLRPLISGVSQRPLPAYAVATPAPVDPADPTALRSHLRNRLSQMGVADSETDRVVEELMNSLGRMDHDDAPPNDDAEPEQDLYPADEVPAHVLRPPAAVARLEAEWHDIYSAGKPFSTQYRPMDGADPWLPSEFARWFEFLKQHPEAFDSLDILDDLVMALESLEEGDWTLDSLRMPLLNRAADIVHQALAVMASPVQLPWGLVENRPALRLLAKHAFHLDDAGLPKDAIASMEQILTLNPMDNHGLRGPLMNTLLRQARDDEALALAARYPRDLMPEICFGRVLALFRQSRVNEATRALRKLHRHGARVIEYLVRERVRKPRFSEYGITAGGDDEAWLYRENMREVWRSVPGLFDLLRRKGR